MANSKWFSGLCNALTPHQSSPVPISEYLRALSPIPTPREPPHLPKQTATVKDHFFSNMSSSDQQINARQYLLSPDNLNFWRSLDGATQMADRAFIGIPAEDDEYTRALFFPIDPSPGERSMPFSSQESDQFDEANSYDASESGTGDVACPVFTPPSSSDAPVRSQPQIMLNGSRNSSTRGAGSLQTPSASGSASLGPSQGMGSPILIQTQPQIPKSKSWTPEILSPSPEATASGHPILLEGMSDPRETFMLEQGDIDFLLQGIQNQSQSESSPPVLSPSHLLDNTLHLSALGSSLPVANTWVTEAPVAGHTRLAPIRTPVSHSGSQATKKERAALTLTAREKAHKVREIGACLRCLVNHEPVRSNHKIPFLSRPTLTQEVRSW